MATQHRRLPRPGFRAGVTRLALGLLLLAAVASCSRAPQGAEGTWRVALMLPGGELPFGLELKRTGGKLAGTILNGEERVEVAETTLDGDQLVLLMPGFQASHRRAREGRCARRHAHARQAAR